MGIDSAEFSWIRIYWMCQNALIIPSIILLAGDQVPIRDKSAGEPHLAGALSGCRIWQFRKRIHHYYFVGLVWVASITWTAFGTYCLEVEPRSSIQHIIDTLTEPHIVTADVTSTMLATGLFMLQLSRRLYESLRVSIFSRRQLLNPIDVILSHAFYLACGITLYAEAPNLTIGNGCFNFSDIRWYHYLSVGLFLYASFHHHHCHKILAKLRRNKSGHIVSTGYKIPRGDWFEYVSCPHYFSECLIYLSICMVLGGFNYTWWWLTSYVCLTQVFLAMNTHKWYQTKFEDYPQNRKMLIPYIF